MKDFLKVDGVNGFLVNNEQEMADKMDHLSSNEKVAVTMGINARKTVIERYSAANFKQKFYYSLGD